MAKDPLVDDLLKGLEKDFSSFRRELATYQYVVDMTRVDPVTKLKIERTLASRFPKLKNFNVLGA